MDTDLTSIQQARRLVARAREAFSSWHSFDQDAVDHVVREMARAGEKAASDLARLAHEETGFGRVDSKTEKNLFASRTLLGQIEGMRTCGIIDRSGPVWEVASPMGVVAALIPSTNPTSTALYKAIISAKARCAIVMSPHPRSARSTAEALRVVADAAYRAGAPEGLFGCLTEISIEGTNALLEHPGTDLIIATGGSAMVRAAYSKGKPAYGVGSGNVPVYVDRSADIEKAGRDIVYGASFDWGTLCSTERSVVADVPIATALKGAMRSAGACFLNDRETEALRTLVATNGTLNINQVGQSPQRIAELAGFEVAASTRVLVAEVTDIGPDEPLSRETLSPILSWYRADGWKAGCDACKRILAHGGMGHTLGLHARKESVIEAFAEEKPAMRIVVNSVTALGSVGHTTSLFPAMTLGPGTLGGSITSDNISPLHLVQIKRVAFETQPVHEGRAPATTPRQGMAAVDRQRTKVSPWMEKIEARLRERAGSKPAQPRAKPADATITLASDPASEPASVAAPSPPPGTSALSDASIQQLIEKFSKD